MNADILWDDGDPREEEGFEVENTPEQVMNWKNGAVTSDHWINVCGACYEKGTENLYGFMIKDTGSGEFKVISKEKLEKAFRGGSFPKGDISVTGCDAVFVSR